MNNSISKFRGWIANEAILNLTESVQKIVADCNGDFCAARIKLQAALSILDELERGEDLKHDDRF